MCRFKLCHTDTQRIRQTHRGTQALLLYKHTLRHTATLTGLPTERHAPLDIQKERQERSDKCPDVREEHLYTTTHVSKKGKTFLLHDPGKESVEESLHAFVHPSTIFPQRGYFSDW